MHLMVKMGVSKGKRAVRKETASLLGLYWRDFDFQRNELYPVVKLNLSLRRNNLSISNRQWFKETPEMKSSQEVFTFVNLHRCIFQKVLRISHSFCYPLVGRNALGEVAVK